MWHCHTGENYRQVLLLTNSSSSLGALFHPMFDALLLFKFVLQSCTSAVRLLLGQVFTPRPWRIENKRECLALGCLHNTMSPTAQMRHIMGSESADPIPLVKMGGMLGNDIPEQHKLGLWWGALRRLEWVWITDWVNRISGDEWRFYQCCRKWGLPCQVIPDPLAQVGESGSEPGGTGLGDFWNFWGFNHHSHSITWYAS